MLLLPFFGIFACLGTAVAAPDSLRVETPETDIELVKSPLIDRIAVKTNAFDWMLTVPNIGFEMDLSGSEFDQMERLQAITGVPIPGNLASLQGKPEKHTGVIEKDAMLEYVLNL